MQNFVQYAPTEVIFGKDTEEQTGSQVKKMGRFQSVDCLWRRQCCKERIA